MMLPVPCLDANPAALSDDDLADATSELAAHIHTATYRLLVLIAEMDRRLVWATQGAKSFPHWLSWACGINVHTAREKVRVAHALESLPLVAAALERGEPGDETYPHDVPAEPRRPIPRNMRRADALAWLADRLLDTGGKVPVVANQPHEIVVHVDAEVLNGASAGRCEIETGSAMAGETARRLACDAAVVPIVDRADGESLSVGRRTRSIPPAIRRALAARDAGCRFPGCNAEHRLHGHHVRHWANGGQTKLDNLVLLCPYHHRLVHEGGFDVERLDGGAFRFLRPDGRAVVPPEIGSEASALAIVDWNRRRGVGIDDATSVAKDNGLGFSLDMAVFGASSESPAPRPQS